MDFVGVFWWTIEIDGCWENLWKFLFSVTAPGKLPYSMKWSSNYVYTSNLNYIKWVSNNKEAKAMGRRWIQGELKEKKKDVFVIIYIYIYIYVYVCIYAYISNILLL